MLGERAGEARPWGMQHLRARAAWHSHGVASELRGFVIDHLGVADAISVLDEMGDLPERPEFSPTDDGRRGSIPSTYNGGASAPRPGSDTPRSGVRYQAGAAPGDNRTPGRRYTCPLGHRRRGLGADPRLDSALQVAASLRGGHRQPPTTARRRDQRANAAQSSRPAATILADPLDGRLPARPDPRSSYQRSPQ